MHVINNTPSGILGGKTPYEVLTGKIPDFSHLRVFGCLGFAVNLKSRRDKFASRSRRCVFVGYSFGKKGWKLYDCETGDIFVSRDVQFHEAVFPFSEQRAPKQSATVANHEDTVAIFDDPTPPPAASSASDAASSNGPNAELADAPLGRGMRAKRSSVLLRDFVTHHVRKYSPSHAPPSPPGFSGKEPRSFREAMADSGWRKAMKAEVQALENNHTWKVVELPPAREHSDVNGSTKLNIISMA